MTEPLDKKAFNEFLKMAFQETPSQKWVLIWCPSCEAMVALGDVPDQSEVKRCEHASRLIEPIAEWVERKEKR